MLTAPDYFFREIGRLVWPLIADVEAVGWVREESICWGRSGCIYGARCWVTGGGALGRPAVSVGHHNRCKLEVGVAASTKNSSYRCF